jgi:hypothetical protein
MYVSELFENIRMGYKDISRPSKKNYTYGVELEIVVSDDVFIEEDVKKKLIQQFSDGSPNLYVKKFISQIWNYDNTKNMTIENLIKDFENVTKARRKDGVKFYQKNDRYWMKYGGTNNYIYVYYIGDFLDSISFAYDFSTLINSKPFKSFLDKKINDLMKANKNSYMSTAKIEYLEQAMKNTINIDRVELDSSVPKGGEVVSNVYDDLNDFLSDLKKAFDRIASDKNLSTDMTTGLHINIGSWKGNEIYNLDVLKFFLIADTMGILKDFDRIGSEYAVPVAKKLIYTVRDMNIKEYSQISKDVTAKILSGADKFDEINFSKLPYDGYIEVRGFGNTDYEKRFNEIKTHILKLIRVLDIAQDPEAYKNDYMKKIIKFLDNKMTNSEEYLSYIQIAIKKDFTKWGKPANINVGSYDVEDILYMARWLRSFIESSRGNSTYLKKIDATIPPNLFTNMIKYIREESEDKSFRHDFNAAKSIIESFINDYYLEYEAPKLEKSLKRIFKI